MAVAVRFAPSPTGRLHLGNMRAAVLNWLFARRHGGSFLLRIDDTDAGRSTAAYEQGIVEDLAWLGLVHDRFVRQSERRGRHLEVLEGLKAQGLLYPCYETEAELDAKRRLQAAMRKPPVYDRAALALSAEDRARLEGEGRRPYWRFRLSRAPVVWHDLIRGEQRIDTAALSDPVLIREDGQLLYTAASVIDDADFAITHVIRGEDHVTNTAAQIELFRAIGAEPPVFAHYPLFVDADGEPLSKRLGALAITALREQGIEPMAIVSLLASLGTAAAPEPALTPAARAATFALEGFGRSAVRLDLRDLEAMNAKLLHMLPFAAVEVRLAALGVGGGEAFWDAVRANITRLDEAAGWWRIAQGTAAPVIEDAGFTAGAAGHLPPEPWDMETWGRFTKAVQAATGRKGRALFHPLRLALTGREHGPDLKTLLPFIGRERAAARLRGETA